MIMSDNKYVKDRLDAIFDVQVRPKQSQKTDPNAWTYFLGSEAKAGLLSLTPSKQFLTAYLDWLAAHNPTSKHWFDNRPDELRQSDEMRLNDGKLPMWTYAGDDETVNLSLRIKPETIETFAQIGRAFGIGAHALVIRNKYFPKGGLRGTTLDTLETMRPKRAAGWVLRAIGMKYLIPHNTLNHNEIETISPWYKLRKEMRDARS